MSNHSEAVAVDPVARKALLTLAAGIADAASAEFAVGVIRYLIEAIDNGFCDPQTEALVWNMVDVIQPPETTRLLDRTFA